MRCNSPGCWRVLFAFFGSPPPRPKVQLMLAMVGFGLCKGFYDSGIFASLYDCIEPHTRGAAVGLINMLAGAAARWGRCLSAISQLTAIIPARWKT